MSETEMSRRHRPMLVVAAGLVLTVIATAAGLPSSAAATSSASSTGQDADLRRLVLRVGPGQAGLARAGVARLGGRVVADQSSLATMVVDVPSRVVPDVDQVPGVAAAISDAALAMTANGTAPAEEPGSMRAITRITGAAQMWQNGWTGSGVDVALIDSGVTPVPGLDDPTRLVIGPDLSFESQDENLRHVDTYGHGTHMAGIIAGREGPAADGAAYAQDTENFHGMAPDARLISLKLADRDGAVDVSQVIAAIDWVVQNRDRHGLDIRVLNLSFGTYSGQNAQLDPLSWAAEVAWKAGIVVVAAAGNEGDEKAGLASPAYNPWVVAVGAQDTRGTEDTVDDTVPSFSGKRGPKRGDRGPDLVAPGVGVLSLRSPNATISGSGSSDSRYLRGTGTSQAAAVVSGAAALLLSQRPGLTPDGVKSVLMRSAKDFPASGEGVQGKGALRLDRAMITAPNKAQRHPQGNGRGSLELARGEVHVEQDGEPLIGEFDVMGNPWDSVSLAEAAASHSAWGADGSFNGAPWAAAGFTVDGTSWDGRTWGGRTWGGRTWGGRTWGGRTWGGRSWGGRSWGGRSWGGRTWSGQSWDGSAWASSSWCALGWE